MWQPIETAPLDQPVLVWDGSFVNRAIGLRSRRTPEIQWYIAINDQTAEYPEDGPAPWLSHVTYGREPTHWMPEPKPPLAPKTIRHADDDAAMAGIEDLIRRWKNDFPERNWIEGDEYALIRSLAERWLKNS